MKKVGLFLIIGLCCVLFNISLIGNVVADDGGYEYKGGWAGIAPESDKDFNKPQGVAVDFTNGYIYVADTENHRVRKFTITGTRTLEWGSYGTQAGQFRSPEGIAVSADGNYVYVSDTSNHRIQKFSNTGAFILSWGTIGTSDGKFNSPTGICVDALGYVYVADTKNDRIQKFNETGTFAAKWTTGRLWEPQGIAVGTSGDIFVADTKNGSIKRFPYNDPGTPTNLSSGFNSPEGIAVDSSGNIYVTDTGNNTVKKFTDTGTLLWTATATTFGSPTGISVNGNYVYVADTNNSRIQRLAIDSGTFTDKWGRLGSSTGILNFPQAMAMDAAGNIYVADTNNHRVQKYEKNGATFTATLKWGGFGSSAGMFNSPQGIAIDKVNNWIYVSDTGNKRIQRFGLEGNFIGTWTNSFQSPQGIVVSTSSDVYVVDAGEGTVGHMVGRFKPVGTPLDTGWPIGQYGASAGKFFNSPQGIAIDSYGNVYIADTGNNRIQKFTLSGSYTLSWGENGTATGMFNSPQGIAIDSWNYIYVADSNNCRIQKFNTEGKFITAWGKEGTETGQFSFPQGIIVGTDNAIFVLDTNNHRIQKFTATPFSVTGITPGTASNNATVSVTVTGTGFLEQATVRLIKPGYADIIATNTMVTNNNTITCTMDLRGQQFGSWSVVVYNPNGHLAIATLTTTAFVINDPDPPTIGSCTTVDTDNNGFIDAIDVAFSEAINDSTVQSSNFKVISTTGTISVGSWTTLGTQNDSYLRLFFEEGTLTTVATPTLSYTPGSLTDLSNNFLGTTTATTIDLAPPFFKLISPTMNGFDNHDVAVEYWLSETVATITLIFTNTATTFVTAVGSLSTLAGTQTATVLGNDLNLTNGTYSVRLAATDLAGNSAVSTTNLNWTYDTGTPTLRLIKPNTAGIDNQGIEVSYLLSEDVATSSLQLIFQNNTGSTTITNLGSLTQGGKQSTHTVTVNGNDLGLQDGATYTVTLIANDLAGNRGTSTPSINWTYKTTPPVATLTAPASNAYGSQTINVIYILGQAVDSIKLVFKRTGGAIDLNTICEADSILLKTADSHTVTIDGSDLYSDGGTRTTDVLVNGAIYSVWLKMVDRAGNIGTSNTNINWKYDTTPPELELIKPVSDGFDNQEISVEYKLPADIDPSTVKLIFQGTSTVHTVTTLLRADQSNSLTIFGNDLNNDGTITTDDCLIPGTYTVILMANDLAGNVGRQIERKNWTYDISIGTPTLKLSDKATESGTYTNKQNIKVVVGNEEADVIGWLLTETYFSNASAVTGVWNTTEPTEFALSSGDGKKTVYVWIKDKAGNISCGSASINLITQAPGFTLIKPESNGFDNATITITYIISGAVDPNSLKLVFAGTSTMASITTGTTGTTGLTVNGGTNTVELPVSLTNGATYTVTLYGKDLAGNNGTSNSNGNWTYDVGLPSPILNYPVANGTENQSIRVEYILSEDVSMANLIFTTGSITKTATLSGVAKGTNTTILDGGTLNMIEATYTVTLQAIDLAGNVGLSTSTTNWQYDTSIGTISLSLQDQIGTSATYTNSRLIKVVIGTPTLTETVLFLLSDIQKTKPIETDLRWQTTQPSTFTLTTTGDGTKTVYLWIKDLAGNISSEPGTASIILDTATPIITLIKPESNGFDNATVTLTYVLSEEMATLTLYFNGTGTPITGNSPGTHSLELNVSGLGLIEATYTVKLTGKDLSGNCGTSSFNTNWTYDITPVTLTLNKPGINGIENESIEVAYQVSEPLGSVTLFFNQISGVTDNTVHIVSGSLTTSGTYTLSGSSINLVNGAIYKVTLNGADRAGNFGTASVSTNWTYDSQVPILTLKKPENNGFDNKTIKVNYVLSEMVATETVQLIFISFGTKTVTATLPAPKAGENDTSLDGDALGLNEGSYTVRLVASDLAGNIGVPSESINWNYDISIGTPTIVLKDKTTGDVGLTNETSVDVVLGSMTEGVKWYLCEGQATKPEEDSLSWNSTKPTGITLSSSDGLKRVDVWIKDLAGNINATSVYGTITLDTQPPSLTLKKPAANGADNLSITVDYTTSEPLSTSTLTFLYTGGEVQDTNHTISGSSNTFFQIDGNFLKSGAIYTVMLNAQDLAGNFALPAVNTNWTYDTKPPIITLDKPKTDGFDNKDIAVSYNLSEECELTNIKLIFASITDPNSPHTVTARLTANRGDNSVTIIGNDLMGTGSDTLKDGSTYTVTLMVTDKAGNEANPAIHTNWTYDNKIDNPSLFKIYDQNSGDGSITVSAVVRVEIESATETTHWILSEVQSVPPAENSSSWLETKPTAFQLSVGNGTKTVYLWCKDRAGNISNPATATIKLDTTLDVTPPVISLILPATGGIDNNSITVSYSLSEPCLTSPTTVRLLFGTQTGTVTSLTGNYGANSVVVDGSSFGLKSGQTYTVTLSMVDYAGNRGTSTPMVINWLYDTEIPSIDGFYLKDRLTQSATYTNSAMVDVIVGSHSSDVIGWIISEEHSDAPSEVSGQWNSKLAVYSLSSGDGTKTVYLWCKDRAGNIGSATARITLDMTNPMIILNSPAANGVSNGSITLNYSLSETIGSGTLVLTFIRTGGATDTAHTVTIGSITAGRHEMMLSGSSLNLRDGAVYAVSLEGLDIAGNRGQVSNANWRYDISIATPTITLNQGAAYTNVSRVSVMVGNDAEAIDWLIGTMAGKPNDDDSRWLTGEPTTFELGAGEGIRGVYLWTRDAVGNISGTATASIVLDTTPATVTLTMLTVDNQSIAATYSLSENVATATISFMGNGQVVGTSLTSLAYGIHTMGLSGTGLGLTDGTYTVLIEASDYAGNSCKSNQVSWRYDISIPTITLNKPASNGIDNHSIAVDYTASEILSSMMLVFSSGGAQVYTVTCGVGTTTIDGSSLINGATYTVQVVGIDTAGNVGSSNMATNWQYDNEIATPTLTIGSVTDSAVINVVIKSATDTIGWLLSETQTMPTENSNQWVSTKPAIFQLSATNGTKTVRLWVKDRAGNVSGTATASIMLNTGLDTTLPIVTLITPAANGADNASIFVSYYLSEPCQNAMITFGTVGTSLIGQYGTNTTTLDGTILGLVNGQAYTIFLSATDMNNNRATSSNTNWTYDTKIEKPSFYLMNKITGSKIYTHSPRVDVSVREHQEAVGWLISESFGTPTEEAVIHLKPTEFTLISGDGTKTVYLWARDMAGNVSEPAIASIILKSDMDTTPPVVNLISPASNGEGNESIQVNYTISEDVSTVVLTFIRTGGTVDGSHSITLGKEHLLAGQHELVVSGLGLKHGAIYSVNLRAVDMYGNSGQGLSTNWQYDALIATPTITLNQGVAYTNVSRVSVTVGNDAEAIGWLIGTETINDLRWLTGEPTTFELGAGEGTKSVYLWTRDAVGNISGTATASIVLDTTPATVTLTMPNVDNQSISISYTSSEPVSSAILTFYSLTDDSSPHQVLLPNTSGSITQNGNDLNNDGNRTTYDYLKDGATYTVTLTVYDMAGNTSTASISPWEYNNSISTPQLTLSGAYTSTQTITVDINNDPDTIGWLISEVGTLTDTGWVTTKPNTFTLTNSDGIKHIYVWVRDTAHNICQNPAHGTIILDIIKPQINLIKPEANQTSNQIVVSYNLSEDVGTLALVFVGQAASYTLNSGLPTKQGTHSIIPSLTLPDGTYSISLSASDIAGNVGSDTHDNWRYERYNTTVGTAALVLRDQITNSSTYTTSSMAKVDIHTEGASGWILSEVQTNQPKANDAGWLGTKPTMFTLSLGDGTKTVYLWYKDTAGNISQQPATATILLSTYSDRQPPSITLKYPAKDGIDNQDILVEYYLSEQVMPEGIYLVFGSITISGTNAGLTTNSGQNSIIIDGSKYNLRTGTYSVSLYANDYAGNVASATNTNWQYDTSLGTPSIQLNGYSSSDIITVNISCDPDVVASIISETQKTKPSPSSIKWEAGTQATVALTTVNGTKTVYVWVMDRAGNINGNSSSIVLDTTNPQVVLNSPSSNGFGNGTFTLGYYLSEDVASITVTFGQEKKEITSLLTTFGDNNVILNGKNLGLVDGASYMITLKATDFAGNISSPASIYNWTYDITPPELRLVYPANNGADNKDIWVEYWLSEDIRPGSIRLMFGTITISNGLSPKAGKQTLEIRDIGLVDGASYTVRLEAMDMAGNLGVTTNSNWKYDVTINTPSLSLEGRFATSQMIRVDIGTDTDVTGWLLSESQSTPPEPNDSRWLTTKPSVFSLSSGSGVKNVYLWVRDMAGNMAQTMKDITIDTELPTIILSQPSANGFGTQNIQVSYSLSEDIASGTLRLSFIRTGGSHDGYSPHRFTLTDVSKGDHFLVGTYSLVDGAIYTVTLEAQDIAGNRAQMATNINWTYDTSAPIINLIKPSSNGQDNHELELVYVLSETVKPDSLRLMFNGTPATATLPYSKGTNTVNIDISGLGLVHGNTYTVSMQARDMADNPSLVVTKTNWTYDDFIATPTLILATSTASRLIYGTITNDNEAVAWLLGEGKSAQPEANDPGWRSTRPTATYLNSAGAGEKQVDLWVRDIAGNVNHTAASITLLTTSASVQLEASIILPTSGEVVSQTIHLQYVLSQSIDPDSLRLVFIHSAGVNDPNSPHTITTGLVPSEGVHDVMIRGNDLNTDGNQTINDYLVDGAVYTIRLIAGTSSISISNIRYDISPPMISLISPVTGGYGNETIFISYQASEPLAEDSLQLVFSRGTETQTVTTWLLSSYGNKYIKGNDLNNDGTYTTSDTLKNGATYTVSLQISDLAGNKSVPVFATNWMYDTAISNPTLSLSKGATYTKSNIVVVETTEDPDIARWLISETQNVMPTIDNPLWANRPTAYSLSAGQGEKTCYLWVQDRAGNINTTPAVDSIILDTIAPQITLISPVTNGAGNGTITVSYYLSEDITTGTLTFKPIGLGSATTLVITGSRGENVMTIKGQDIGLNNGTRYTISLNAEDFAGNIGITATSHNWRYDTTIGKPTLLLRDYLTNNTQYTGAKLIRVEIGGNNEDVKWLIDEDPMAINSELPWQQDKPTYFTLGTTSGMRTVFLWMKDTAGNISDTASCSITLDMELPTLPGTPTANGRFFPGGAYTISWDPSSAVSGIMQYEVQEYSGSMTPVADDWKNKATTYLVSGTNSLGFKNKKHGDSFWYRVRARNNIEAWGAYSGVSERVIIAELFGTNTDVSGSSTDGGAVINIPKGVLTLDTYLIIGRDPLNHPRIADPKAIQYANAKDDADLSWDRVDNTITEINAYVYHNGTDTPISTFTQKVKISLKYLDVNQDGFVDNMPYKLDELTLKMYWLNEVTKKWEQIEDSVVDPINNIVSADVYHLSTFMLSGIPLRPAAVLGNVRVYPNPYKPNSNPMHNSGIHFGGTMAPYEERLTEDVTIKIFTVSGELVRMIDTKTSGEYIWDAKNADGDEVSTGVYIYQITNEQAGNSFGKIAIIK